MTPDVFPAEKNCCLPFASGNQRHGRPLSCLHGLLGSWTTALSSPPRSIFEGSVPVRKLSREDSSVVDRVPTSGQQFKLLWCVSIFPVNVSARARKVRVPHPRPHRLRSVVHVATQSYTDAWRTQGAHESLLSCKALPAELQV